MSFGDKVEHKIDELRGAAKEKVGDATDNRSMQAEGARDKNAARGRQAREHLADAGRHVKKALGG